MTETTLALWSSLLPGAGAAAPSQRPLATAKAPQSWYRTPYRSPFDPRFWLEPSLADGAGLWPWWGRNGFAAEIVPPALAMPWLALSRWPATAPGAALPVDLATSAFAAYRSMGGHAVAQTLMPASMLPSLTAPATPPFGISPVDAWMRAAFPWLAR